MIKSEMGEARGTETVGKTEGKRGLEGRSIRWNPNNKMGTK